MTTDLDRDYYRNSGNGFNLTSEFSPAGDQPRAIDQLTESLNAGHSEQTLLGVTGSGKTFTAASVIRQLQRPALILSHNKTLAAQLYNEFSSFFPENSVEFFVSFYDYYQPEAYVPQSDTYIEKDSSINQEINRLRLSATTSLMQSRDVIVVASVSAIYGLGSPESYRKKILPLKPGLEISRRRLFQRLLTLQYERNDVEFTRGKFRARGDIVEIFPAYEDNALRVEMFDDEIERLEQFDPLSGEILGEGETVIYPANHYVLDPDKKHQAVNRIRQELEEREEELLEQGKNLAAERLRSRTEYDLEILQETGYVNGIENYSRHLDGRQPGEPPYTLLDYFPSDFITFIDESHQTIPQLRAMIAGDRSRKDKLVEHGFRLPSAYDNRPLEFHEFNRKTGQLVYVSATPGDYERQRSRKIIEQIVRPTGLVDPPVEVKPTKDQVDDLMDQVEHEVEKQRRVLVTTLTKRLSENLTDYLIKMGFKVRYLHSEIDTLERSEILRDLRLGEFDVLVGINLLREGLDLPEVSLVAILDADRSGFLRSATTLIQMIGRTARNLNGRVIMYADEITPAMKQAIEETDRRRQLQIDYNVTHNIEPQTIKKKINQLLPIGKGQPDMTERIVSQFDSPEKRLEELTVAMQEAAERLEFELAARYRDKIQEITADRD